MLAPDGRSPYGRLFIGGDIRTDPSVQVAERANVARVARRVCGHVKRKRLSAVP